MAVRLGWAAAIVLVVAALVGPAAAQDSSSAPPAPVGTTGSQPPIDARKLGIDLARIRRQLVRVTVREERDGMNLRYAVDVFGMAPPLELFPASRVDPNYFTSPAPYGAPTHRDFLNLNTPEEHRAMPADVGALFRWLADKTKREKPTNKR